MLSFSKILLLVLVVVAVFFGVRMFRRVSAVGRERLRPRGDSRPPSRDTRRAAAPPAGVGLDAEDMEKCPECGAYVAPHAAVACGRPACPYGR